MTTKSKRGGKRPGAGRKAADDKNVPIRLLVRESMVTSIGGIDSVKQVCYDAIQKRD